MQTTSRCTDKQNVYLAVNFHKLKLEEVTEKRKGFRFAKWLKLQKSVLCLFFHAPVLLSIIAR